MLHFLSKKQEFNVNSGISGCEKNKVKHDVFESSPNRVGTPPFFAKIVYRNTPPPVCWAGWWAGGLGGWVAGGLGGWWLGWLVAGWAWLVAGWLGWLVAGWLAAGCKGWQIGFDKFLKFL